MQELSCHPRKARQGPMAGHANHSRPVDGSRMAPKPAQWFERVLDRVLANGMSDYERAVFGK